MSSSTIRTLLGTTAAVLLSVPAVAQDGVECGVDLPRPMVCDGTDRAGVIAQQASEASRIPGRVPPASAGAGFAISINGTVITGDAGLPGQVRQADIALAEAGLQVVFDGLSANPRLILVRTDAAGAARAGDEVTVRSMLNYPAFVDRAEVRILDMAAPGGPRLVGTVPITANGTARITVPEGRGLALVHRVYDRRGRFDETEPLPLGETDAAARSLRMEEGADTTRTRSIRVVGGAVRVSGTGLVPGASVSTLGERFAAGPDGGFVIERILPPGEYPVAVEVRATGQNLDLERPVTIPRAEWFGFGTVDLTFGATRAVGADWQGYDRGRIAGYVEGRLADGTEITASADTGFNEFSDLFSGLDEWDPARILDLIDAGDLYPTYGDDSIREDRTPTSGRIFLRVERDGNYLQWGNDQVELDNNALIANTRTLYGLSGVWRSVATTADGAPRAAVSGYAAQPGRLPRRDEFLGTGGSVYFLGRQGIAPFSEVVQIELRDPDTGRVLHRDTLRAGTDYVINPAQGIVTLRRPLTSVLQGAGILPRLLGETEAHLVVNYEYTPAAQDLDGYAYGLRAEVWATDRLRFGVVGVVDQTGLTDHQVVGADLRWQIAANSALTVDYATSEGPGFGASASADGGLVFDRLGAAIGTGQAVRAEISLDAAEFGLAEAGVVSAHYEHRTEGFASLGTSVTGVTGDETFYGIEIDLALSAGQGLAVELDHYENGVGDRELKAAAAVSGDLAPAWSYEVGLGYRDIDSDGEVGTRTDLGARLNWNFAVGQTAYVFGTRTLAVEGVDRDDRLGVGYAQNMGRGWRLAAELSDGTSGPGARVSASHDDGEGNTRYVSYDLDPERALGDSGIVGQDRGVLTAGGTLDFGNSIRVFGESTRDLFGNDRSLSQSYGLRHRVDDYLSWEAVFELGRVDDGGENDFERTAVSFGVDYADDATSASGRLEFRREDGLRSGSAFESETWRVAGNVSHKISEAARLLASADLLRVVTDESDVLDGIYADVVLGYAFRPVDNNRLNVLARYRYLHDDYGRRVSDIDEQGPRQKTHMVSVDASYDLDRFWTIGAKIGGRWSETAAVGSGLWNANDAWLIVGTARYHLVGNWDLLGGIRSLHQVQAGTAETGALIAVDRQLGANLRLGVGYNFTTFTDDLTDLSSDNEGAFFNIFASF